MRVTQILRWKSLVSKLHPPVPITPHESARLLALLNASFRKQLAFQPFADRLGNEHPTDLHLRTILKNPLFEKQSRDASLEGLEGSGRPLGQVRDLLQRPTDNFTAQIAAGTATLDTALCCLRICYYRCLAAPNASPVIAMRASATGTVVLEWLWSSGLEDSLQFLKQRDFARLLIKFLVAEGRQGRVQYWLRRLQDQACKGSSRENSITYYHTLSYLLSSEESIGKGVEAVTAHFVQIVQAFRREHGMIEELTKPLRRVAHRLTVNLMTLPKTPELQKRTLDPFINTMKHSFHKPSEHLTALHDVYLVRCPSPDSAIRYFQTLPEKVVSLMPAPIRSQIVQFGLLSPHGSRMVIMLTSLRLENSRDVLG